MADLWRTFLLAAFVFSTSLQGHAFFACDVAEHLLALLPSCCFARHHFALHMSFLLCIHQFVYSVTVCAVMMH